MLLRAIRAVAQGEALLATPIAQRALEQFAQPPPVTPRPETYEAFFDDLTPREIEVLRLIAQGLRNREIAAKLVISEKTVGNHISNIFTKLQVNDRSQAIVRALRGGLVDEEQSGQGRLQREMQAFQLLSTSACQLFVFARSRMRDSR